MPTIDMISSPYDRDPGSGELPLVQLTTSRRPRWVPSRFNARTLADDGRLIVWNTYTGSISVFQPESTPKVLALLSPAGLSEPLDEAADYMCQRGFIVRADADELAQFRYRYAKEQWRSDVLQFHLLASEDCNFRCVYCYEQFKRGTMRPEVRQGVRALVQSRASTLTQLDVSWFGGEPLYGWEAINELAPFFKEIAEQYGIEQSQNMTTNGYLLTEERASSLLYWGCRSFQITLDGLPEDHDCKRMGRDGSPTFGVILQNLRAMKKRRDTFEIVVRVNFDQLNSPKLENFLDFLSQDFAGDSRFEMRFRPVGKWGGAQDDQLATCGIGEDRLVHRRLQQKARDVHLHQEGGIRNTAQLGSQVCYAARPYNFIVGATGKLMKCTIALDKMPDNVVGQLHPDGTMELRDELMSKWVNPHFETDKLCQSCYVLPTCQGAACPLTRIQNNQRTCCGIKSNLKHEMRITLAEAKSGRAAATQHV